MIFGNSWRLGGSGLQLNDGAGNFVESISFPSSDASTYGLALADVDADGDLDLLLASFTRSNSPAPYAAARAAGVAQSIAD